MAFSTVQYGQFTYDNFYVPDQKIAVISHQDSKLSTSKQLACKQNLRQYFKRIQLVLDDVTVLNWY